MTAAPVESLSDLRVAAVQAESRAGDVERNVETAVAWATKAAAKEATLVVLPELFLCGYHPQTLRAEADRCDVTPEDPRLAPLAGAARDCRITVVVGASVRSPNGERSVALLVFSAAGEVLVAYVKQHLWDEERSIFTRGRGGASVLLGGWHLGMAVCYDGCFPEHARAAAEAGALAYLCPSAYVVGSEHRRDLYYAARALDNGIYVIFSGLVGACGDLEFSGGTAIYDPQGRPVDRVASGEGIAVTDLDQTRLEEARRINPYDRDRPTSLGARSLIRL